MDTDSSPRIGLVTGPSVPELSDDGQALQQTLTERGYGASGVVWSDKSVEWNNFDILLFRSCWEYYQRPEAFREWLDTVDEQVQQVINPARVIEWNMHKSYLEELEEASDAVAPTTCIERGSASLSEICERNGWERVVVKPAIGTSSDGVWEAELPVSDNAENRFRSELGEGDFVVQEFQPAIADGELSMVFFAGEFSHATRTIPAKDDFRADTDYGASSSSVSPPASVRETGRELLDAAGDCLGIDRTDLTYARVDGVVQDEDFVLLELELIEPYLSLTAADGTIERFADAIEEAIAPALRSGRQG